jgi:hypothetical protein
MHVSVWFDLSWSRYETQQDFIPRRKQNMCSCSWTEAPTIGLLFSVHFPSFVHHERNMFLIYISKNASLWNICGAWYGLTNNTQKSRIMGNAGNFVAVSSGKEVIHLQNTATMTTLHNWKRLTIAHIIISCITFQAHESSRFKTTWIGIDRVRPEQRIFAIVEKNRKHHWFRTTDASVNMMLLSRHPYQYHEERFGYKGHPQRLPTTDKTPSWTVQTSI